MLTREAKHLSERLDDTPHLWALIAVLYAYVTLFALVVALTVIYG